MVQIINQLGVKKGAKSLISGSLIIFMIQCKLRVQFESQKSDFWTDLKNLGGPIVLLSSVRPSVRPDGFRSNGSIVFSDFWHQGSFLWFQKTDEAGFLKKKFFWPKMAKKV